MREMWHTLIDGCETEKRLGYDGSYDGFRSTETAVHDSVEHDIQLLLEHPFRRLLVLHILRRTALRLSPQPPRNVPDTFNIRSQERCCAFFPLLLKRPKEHATIDGAPEKREELCERFV